MTSRTECQDAEYAVASRARMRRARALSQLRARAHSCRSVCVTVNNRLRLGESSAYKTEVHSAEMLHSVAFLTLFNFDALQQSGF